MDSVPQASVPITGGTATFSTGSLTGGNHTITATYSGDTNNLGSTSAPLAQTVKANSTTVLTSSPNPSIVGQSVTFTATLTSLGGPTPTGTVQFAVDGVNQGGPVPVSGGTATFSTSTLTPGNHNVNAVYSGDGSNLTSNGFTTQTVNGVAPNITSANSTTFRVGVAGTFTVTTTGNPPSSLSEAGALPSGVTFVNNGSGSATLSGTPAAGTSGTFPFTITASNGVVPNAVQLFTLTVSSASTTTSLTSSLNPSLSGQAVTFTATVTGASPTGTVQFKDGAPNLGTPVTLAGGRASFNTSTLT